MVVDGHEYLAGQRCWKHRHHAVAKQPQERHRNGGSATRLTVRTASFDKRPRDVRALAGLNAEPKVVIEPPFRWRVAGTAEGVPVAVVLDIRLSWLQAALHVV